jgi:ATP-dependent protease Clp ATPase subunit
MKSQDVVAKLISSPSNQRAYICDECVTICQSILDDDRQARHALPEPLAGRGLWVAGAYNSESEAQQVQAALKAAGMPAHVSGRWGWLVLVHKENLDDALALLDPE